MRFPRSNRAAAKWDSALLASAEYYQASRLQHIPASPDSNRLPRVLQPIPENPDSKLFPRLQTAADSPRLQTPIHTHISRLQAISASPDSKLYPASPDSKLYPRLQTLSYTRIFKRYHAGTKGHQALTNRCQRLPGVTNPVPRFTKCYQADTKGYQALLSRHQRQPNVTKPVPSPGLQKESGMYGSGQRDNIFVY